MEDNSYNRKIAKQVEAINRRYILDSEKKGYMLEPGAISTNLRGAGFWDDFGHGFVQGFQMPFKALSGGAISTGGIATGGKRRGRPRKMAGCMNCKIAGCKDCKMGGNFLDDLAGTALHLAPLLALGKPKRKASKKAGSIALDNREQDFSTPSASGKPKKGGAYRKLLKARAVGSGLAEMEGAGFFNDVLGGISKGLDLTHKVLDVSDRFGRRRGRGKAKKGGIATGGIATGGGFLDDVFGGISKGLDLTHKVLDVSDRFGRRGRGKAKKGGIATGGKRGVSAWISHVKKYAKDHNIKYNEALKDPKCKASYRK